MAEWASATIHLSSYGEIRQVFFEQVQAQVMARTQGALPRARDIYKLAAPMGRFWQRKLLLHFKVDSSTLRAVLWTAFHTCTTGAQHRTLEERPILSGYRWQF